MPDKDRNNGDEKNTRKTGEFRVPPRTWLVWIIIFGGIVLLVLFRDRMDPHGVAMSERDIRRVPKQQTMVLNVFADGHVEQFGELDDRQIPGRIAGRVEGPDVPVQDAATPLRELNDLHKNVGDVVWDE